MIPLWMSIAVCGERRRFFRLWLPLFLFWLLLLPFAILALPVLLIVWLVRGRAPLEKLLTFYSLFRHMRGLRMEIDHPRGAVFIRVV